MKVYKAINAVQADLCRDGITKDKRNQTQGYNFRGIDDVYNALSPLLAKHGLCILPRILTREVIERQTQKGGVLFYVTVAAEFDFVCAEDGSTHTVRTFGEAMDSADKATNKAMSAAYKYAAFQAFAIPTEADNDADAHHHVVAPISTINAKPTDGAWDGVSAQDRAAIEAVAATVGEYMEVQDAAGAHEYLERQALDSQHKIALWTLLDSKTRAALKKAHKEAA